MKIEGILPYSVHNPTGRDMTQTQRVSIKSLLNVFGNYGPCHCDEDHKYLTALLATEVDERDLYKASVGCRTLVDQILSSITDDEP